MTLGALILAGGASTRMGVDKARLEWGGVRAVDRLANLAAAVAAAPVLTVGAGDYGLPRVVEDPPGSGPAAGVVAGARRLASGGARRVLVLAVDAPTLAAADLGPLLASPSPGAVYADLHLPLVLEVAALPLAGGAGWSLRRLIAELGLRELPPPARAAARLRGANTPEEREALLAELAARSRAEAEGA